MTFRRRQLLGWSVLTVAALLGGAWLLRLDYAKKISKSVRRLAFQKALSERIRAGDVLTVGEFAVKELKTKAFVSLVKKQTDARRVLIGDRLGGLDGSAHWATTARAGRRTHTVVPSPACELTWISPL